MSAWYNKTMAFPATYDFNYYKGDTFEFRIYPKKNDGTVFDLSQYYVPTNFANTPDYFVDNSTPYDSAQFTISTVRGSDGEPVKCFARVSDDGTFVQCAIRPLDSQYLVAGTEYVYDVEVRKPAGSPGGVSNYEIVHTLLTGTITITDQVTGATTATQGSLSNYRIGLTQPVTCATPETSVIETAEYSGTVVWSGSPETFDADTSYTATITITPKLPYRLIGTPANFFTVDGASTVTNSANSGVVTVVYPKTAKVVSTSSISLSELPVVGQIPVSDIIQTSQFYGSVAWSPTIGSSGIFEGVTEYTATITITPKTGYTLCGVEQDFFTVSGATTVTNPANSGVVTAEFPTTESATPTPTPVAPTPTPVTPTPVTPTPVAEPIASPTPIAPTPITSPIAEPTPVATPTAAPTNEDPI
jgi:hypothetical protein